MLLDFKSGAKPRALEMYIPSRDLRIEMYKSITKAKNSLSLKYLHSIQIETYLYNLLILKVINQALLISIKRIKMFDFISCELLKVDD